MLVDFVVVAGAPPDRGDAVALPPLPAARYVVDVAVVFPGKDEALPAGYVRVSSVDLNEGKFWKRATWLAVKYGWSADGAAARAAAPRPVTQVGVYHGAVDAPLPDGWERVAASVGGRVANLNVGTSGRDVYLILRRLPAADDDANADASVVTDLAVIDKSHGEACPAGFGEIDLNLNLGSGGHPLYLCTKSVRWRSRDDLILPVLLERFPREDSAGSELPPSIEQFCMPRAVQRQQFPRGHSIPLPEWHPFVLTEGDGGRLFGAALTFWEAVPPVPPSTPPPRPQTPPAVPGAASSSSSSSSPSLSPPPLSARPPSTPPLAGQEAGQPPRLSLDTVSVAPAALVATEPSGSATPLEPVALPETPRSPPKSPPRSPPKTPPRSPPPPPPPLGTPPPPRSSSGALKAETDEAAAAPAATAAAMATVEMVTYQTKCVAILSHHPFFHGFKKALKLLYQMGMGGTASFPLERYIAHLALCVPLPDPGTSVVLDWGLGAVNAMIFPRPEREDLPMVGVSFLPMFHMLSPHNIVRLWSLLCLERKLILHSRDLDVVTPILEAVRALTFPLDFSGIYIPMCATHIVEPLLSAPMPFAIGLASEALDYFEIPAGVWVVDVDGDTIGRSPGDGMPPVASARDPASELPAELASAFEGALHAVCTQAGVSRDGVADVSDVFQSTQRGALASRKLLDTSRVRDAALRTMVALIGGYEQFLCVNNEFIHNAKLREAREEAEERRALRAAATAFAAATASGGSGEPASDAPGKLGEADDDSSASLDPVSSLKTTTRQGLEAVFEMETFLASKPASWRPFLIELGGAMSFARMMNERTLPSSSDLGFVFFDACHAFVVAASAAEGDGRNHSIESGGQLPLRNQVLYLGPGGTAADDDEEGGGGRIRALTQAFEEAAAAERTVGNRRRSMQHRFSGELMQQQRSRFALNDMLTDGSGDGETAFGDSLAGSIMAWFRRAEAAEKAAEMDAREARRKKRRAARKAAEQRAAEDGSDLAATVVSSSDEEVDGDAEGAAALLTSPDGVHQLVRGPSRKGLDPAVHSYACDTSFAPWNDAMLYPRGPRRAGGRNRVPVSVAETIPARSQQEANADRRHAARLTKALNPSHYHSFYEGRQAGSRTGVTRVEVVSSLAASMQLRHVFGAWATCSAVQVARMVASGRGAAAAPGIAASVVKQMQRFHTLLEAEHDVSGSHRYHRHRGTLDQAAYRAILCCCNSVRLPYNEGAAFVERSLQVLALKQEDEGYLGAAGGLMLREGPNALTDGQLAIAHANRTRELEEQREQHARALGEYAKLSPDTSRKTPTRTGGAEGELGESTKYSNSSGAADRFGKRRRSSLSPRVLLRTQSSYYAEREVSGIEEAQRLLKMSRLWEPLLTWEDGTAQTPRRRHRTEHGSGRPALKPLVCMWAEFHDADELRRRQEEAQGVRDGTRSVVSGQDIPTPRAVPEAHILVRICDANTSRTGTARRNSNRLHRRHYGTQHDKRHAATGVPAATAATAAAATEPERKKPSTNEKQHQKRSSNLALARPGASLHFVCEPVGCVCERKRARSGAEAHSVPGRPEVLKVTSAPPSAEIAQKRPSLHSRSHEFPKRHGLGGIPSAAHAPHRRKADRIRRQSLAMVTSRIQGLSRMLSQASTTEPCEDAQMQVDSESILDKKSLAADEVRRVRESLQMLGDSAGSASSEAAAVAAADSSSSRGVDQRCGLVSGDTRWQGGFPEDVPQKEDVAAEDGFNMSEVHGSVAYISPLSLRTEIEELLHRQGRGAFACASMRQSHPDLFYNMVWFCTRLQLPLPFFGDDGFWMGEDDTNGVSGMGWAGGGGSSGATTVAEHVVLGPRAEWATETLRGRRKERQLRREKTERTQNASAAVNSSRTSLSFINEDEEEDEEEAAVAENNGTQEGGGIIARTRMTESPSTGLEKTSTTENDPTGSDADNEPVALGAASLIDASTLSRVESEFLESLRAEIRKGEIQKCLTTCIRSQHRFMPRVHSVHVYSLLRSLASLEASRVLLGCGAARPHSVPRYRQSQFDRVFGHAIEELGVQMRDDYRDISSAAGLPFDDVTVAVYRWGFGDVFHSSALAGGGGEGQEEQQLSQLGLLGEHLLNERAALEQ